MKKEDVLKILNQIEHPEIAVNLVELGMMADLAVEEKVIKVALALPVSNVPAQVLQAIEQSISRAVYKNGLTADFHYFDMQPEEREKIFSMARAKWKGRI